MTNSDRNNRDRYSYGSNWYDPKKDKKTAMIIGLGNEGSNLAFILAKMGFNLILCDYDIIEEHNMGAQFYNSSHIGMNKVDALFNQLNVENSDNIYTKVNEKITKDNISSILSSYNMIDYIVLATDTMKSRIDLFNAIDQYLLSGKTNLNIMMDVRSSGIEFQIFNIDLMSIQELELYKSNLYTDDDAVNEGATTACGVRNLAYFNQYKTSIMAHLIMNDVRKNRFNNPKITHLTGFLNLELPVINVIK